MTEEIFLAPAEAVLYLEPTARLSGLRIEDTLETDALVKPFWSVTYDVEDYHVVDGFPVADTAMGIGIPVEVTTQGVSASMTLGEIFSNGPKNVVSRWLPVDGSFDDPEQWTAAPTQPDPDHPGPARHGIPLYTEGTTPVLDTSFDYVRHNFAVAGAAMRLFGDDYLSTDGLSWGADSLGVLMVAVLRSPLDDTYALLETFPQGGADIDRSFISLHYHSDGAITTHSLGQLNNRQTSSQGMRVGVPLVVGFRLEQPRTLTTVIVDQHPTATDFKLADAHPQDAKLFVGRSQTPGFTSVGCFDILEMDYFEDISRADFVAAASGLDALYGVSS